MPHPHIFTIVLLPVQVRPPRSQLILVERFGVKIRSPYSSFIRRPHPVSFCGIIRLLGDGAQDFIGGRFAISGGLIRSAAVRADAWRIGLDVPLTTPLVLASLARELEKNDRSSVEAMVEPYRDAVLALLEGPLEDAS